MNYSDYLMSNDWKTKRNNKVRNKRCCFVCKSTENLHVHHLKYRNLFNVKSKDLKVMCKRCHFLTHDLVKEGKISFKKDNHKHKMSVIIKTIRPLLNI